MNTSDRYFLENEKLNRKDKMIDFSSAGLIDGLKKVGSVAIYIIASMLVIGLGMFVANVDVTWAEVQSAMLVGGANLVIVFLKTWLGTAK